MKLDKLETQAVDFVARFSPWLAPLPTAYLTATATVEHLAWPQAVGIIAGVIVEALGLSSVSTALKLREYNATRRKIPDDWEPTDKNGKRKTYRGIVDPPAPFKLTIITAVVYFVAVTFLTVALDTAPNLATYAPLVFPVMSLAGAIVLAVRADHKRRLDAIAGEEAERKAKRQERRLDRKEQEIETAIVAMQAEADQKAAAIEQQLTEARRKAQETLLESLGIAKEVYRQYAETPTATQAEVAETLGITERTVRNHLHRLEGAGLIRRNGGGVEILK